MTHTKISRNGRTFYYYATYDDGYQAHQTATHMKRKYKSKWYICTRQTFLSTKYDLYLTKW